MRAPTGTRIEETTLLTDQVEQKIRALIPPDRITGIVDNVGLPNSGINISYGNSGTIGVFDADISISLKEGEASTDDDVKMLREKLPAAFPGTTFAFLPADIVTQILNFGSPAPLDIQIAGAEPQRQPRLHQQVAWRRFAMSPAIAGSPDPGAIPGSRAQGRFQPGSRRRRRPDGKRRSDEHSGDAFGQHPDGADLLAESNQWRVLSRFGPDAAI